MGISHKRALRQNKSQTVRFDAWPNTDRDNALYSLETGANGFERPDLIERATEVSNAMEKGN